MSTSNFISLFVRLVCLIEFNRLIMNNFVSGVFFLLVQVKLDSFLEMPDVLLLPQVNLLQSNAHRSTVQKRSFNVIIAIYKQIYGLYRYKNHLHLSISHAIFLFVFHVSTTQNEFTIPPVIWKHSEPF